MNQEVPAAATVDVLFTTTSTTVSLKDSGGAVLGGGTVRFHQVGWQDWAPLTRLEFAGQLHVRDDFQQWPAHLPNEEVPAAATADEVFTTTTTTIRSASATIPVSMAERCVIIKSVGRISDHERRQRYP